MLSSNSLFHCEARTTTTENIHFLNLRSLLRRMSRISYFTIYHTSAYQPIGKLFEIPIKQSFIFCNIIIAAHHFNPQRRG